jgi:hypothetical protein
VNWGEEDIPGRLTNRERAWRAKRSVRVLGADGIPPIMNPGGTSVMGQRGPVLAVASDFDPDMVPEVSEEDRARFLAFLEANAAEVATWPAWKQRAFQLVKESSDG